jgi:hypothetical protein
MERVVQEAVQALALALDDEMARGEFVSAKRVEQDIVIALLHPNPYMKGKHLATVWRVTEGGRLRHCVRINPDGDLPTQGVGARDAFLAYLSENDFAQTTPQDSFWPTWTRERHLLA